MKTRLLFVLFIFAFIHIHAQEKIFYGDCKNGFGVKVTADKTSILGYFQDGQMNGYSLAIMPNGDMYAGFLKNNVCWGKGIFLYSQGFIYMGDYVNNAMEGSGTLFVPNTQIQDGTFSKNQQVQVTKIETKNVNSTCLLGDCEKGPGLIFENVQSFSCIGKDMIFERRPDGYQYFGPRSGEGYMAIITKEYFYVGMGKDRLPKGEGGKFYNLTSTVDFGNWYSIKIGDQDISICCGLNKTCPLQISLSNQFKVPVNEKINNVKFSKDFRKMMVWLEDLSCVSYDIDKKILSPLSGSDKVRGFAISNDGKFGAYITPDQLKVFDLSTNKVLFTFNDTVISDRLVFTPDNKYLIYCVNKISFSRFKWISELAKVIDLKNGLLVNDFVVDSYTDELGPLATYDINSKDFYYFDYHGPLIITDKNQLFFNFGNDIKIIDCMTDSLKKFFKYSYEERRKSLILRFTVSPSGTRLATVNEQGVRIWNAKTAKEETWISETSNYTIKDMSESDDIRDKDFISTKIKSLNFSPNDSSLIIKIDDNLMFIKLDQKTSGQSGDKTWFKNYTVLQTIKIPYVVISLDGSKLIYRSWDGVISIYDIKY
ncbi:MAG: hypothetical protein M0R16_12750 [Bacteroidales bacterium]|jgi:hypothetical protein|nr:hypothetical protein [Bacteroidales bacterium]